MRCANPKHSETPAGIIGWFMPDVWSPFCPTCVVRPADCCGITLEQSENDGHSLVQVGRVVVCGGCLVEAGVQDEEDED